MPEQFVLHDCGEHGTLEVRHGDTCPCCDNKVLIQNESAVVTRSVMSKAQVKQIFGVELIGPTFDLPQAGESSRRPPY